MARTYPASPPGAQLVLRVGVIGCRPDRLAEADEELLRTKIREVLELLRDSVQDVHAALGSVYTSGPATVRLISRLTEGAECMVVQEALDMGFELQCPLLFQGEHEKDFEPPESRKAYRDMLDKATAVLELDGSGENLREAYEAVGRMVLKQCDVLLAIWDGEQPEGKGSTGQSDKEAALPHIVEEAARLEVPTVWIHSCAPHDARLRVRREDGRMGVGLHELPIRFGQLLLPPSPPHPDLRKAYFLERQRQWTLGFLFKAFRNLIADRRLGRLEWRLPKFEGASEEWRQAWQASGLPQGIAEHIDSRFLSHFYWADKLADYYANLYRSSFTAIYLMGAFAVLFALLAHVREEEGRFLGWILLELIFILLISAIVLFGTHRRWHERWIDYRLLAEQLRQMRFLAPLGLTLPSIRVPAHYGQGDPRNTWANWHFRAIARAAGMVKARMDPFYLDAYRKLLTEYEIQSQITYHTENACRTDIIHHRLHWLGKSLFVLAFLVCVLHLLGALYPEIHSPWLTLCAAVVPAFGGAVYAIRSHGEFHGIAERSTAMRARLKSLKEMADQLPSAHNVPSSLALSHTLGQIAEAAADTMIADVHDWRILFRDKPLEPP